MLKSIIIIAIALFIALTITNARAGVIGKDTTITLPEIPLINGKTDSTITIVLPDTSFKYQQILMHYSLSYPKAGGDPYDRIGQFIVTKNNQTYEVGRFITPFLKACSWTIDVTDFRSLLADTTQFREHILYYVTAGSGQGYLVNVSFDFIGGIPKKEAYKIENLWCNDEARRWEYGSYVHPISDSILPKLVTIDPKADSIHINVNCTGHGEFNTDNCGEFCSKVHTLRIDSDSTSTFTHTLWRSDCNTNTCNNQNGTWTYSRQGWCPGANVIPWNVDITPYAKGHNTIWVEYLPEQYHNSCGPDDSTCAKNVATNCNPYYKDYGSGCDYTNGHTFPFFVIQSQIIYYKKLPFTGIENYFSRPPHFTIYPNPSIDGNFTIDLTFVKNDDIEIYVVDVLGRKIYEQKNISAQSKITVSLEDKSNGLYFVQVRSINGEASKKIMIQR